MPKSREPYSISPDSTQIHLATEEEVILVTETDEAIGAMEKMQAHREGRLHRAFSIFIFNARGEMLLQRRAAGKYHSRNLWTNACCSHPRVGEATEAAAHRRLQEELCFDAPLAPFATLLYRADVGEGLIENEYDHLFVGTFSDAVSPNLEEVSEVTYMPMENIEAWMQQEPQYFTAWFHLAFPMIGAHLRERGNLFELGENRPRFINR